MTSQQQSVEYLFGEALEREPGARRAFLDNACAASPELRRQVDELLLADERAGSFLEQPAADLGATDPSDAKTSGMLQDCGEIQLNAALDAPAVRFRTGDKIAERFLVVRFIARGGMGEVYEVEDTLLRNVHVALKIILPQIAGDHGTARRFEQEVLLARRVVHPNLCPIYDISRCAETEPPFLFMTMKLLTGETLAARLRRGTRILADDAQAIYRQMVAGIAAIHAGGIVHRDIKPNNVMLERTDETLEVIIMDFGLARLHGAETTLLSHGMVAGTPGYLAPELLRGQSPSQATDIFALGVLMHQVLTGEHPIAKPNTFSIEPSPMLALTDAPSSLTESVREFLSEGPERRLEAFRRARASLGPTVDTTGGIHISRRAFALGGAAAAVAVTGGIAWHFDWMDDLLHPIPAKRFVALLNWPMQANAAMAPVVNGVIDAIAEQLARAEAFDHNLYVTTHNIKNDLRSPAELNELRDSLGANLVLAASATTRNDQYHVNLRLLDTSSTRALRERQVSTQIDEQALLPERAVRAAEHLLNVSKTQPTMPNKGGTQSAEAFASFQEAEALRKEENETGLDEAIVKYKAAIEADPKYALAHMKLAASYSRMFQLKHDPAALELARANAKTAIALQPNLAQAHVTMAAIKEDVGDYSGALNEVDRAIAVDPSDPRTLVYQAQILTRMKRWKDADAAYKRVLTERPNYWLAYQELGFNAYSQGKYQQALTAFRSASLAAPKNALALANVGAMYEALGMWAEAKESFLRSIQLNPLATTYTSLADALRVDGKYADAVDAGRKSVSIDANDPEGWQILADAYAAVGNKELANDAYARTLRLQQAGLQVNPNDSFGWLRVALCLIKTGQSDGVKNSIRKAELLNASDIDSQLLRIRVLELLHNRVDALAAVATSLKTGATPFQLQTIPDLEQLRTDARYKAILQSTSATLSD